MSNNKRNSGLRGYRLWVMLACYLDLQYITVKIVPLINLEIVIFCLHLNYDRSWNSIKELNFNQCKRKVDFGL